MNRPGILTASLSVIAILSPLTARSQIVINEVLYDDTPGTTDDREFVELYNAGAAAVDIGSWVLGAYDLDTTANPSTTIPANTILQPGAFFVIGNAGVLNVNHTVPISFLENDGEFMTLRNAAGELVDAVAFETNKGVAIATTSPAAPPDAAAVAAQIGPGIFGNSQGADVAGTPLRTTVSLGRFVDGRDTNNNGRDFGVRPATPGTTNTPSGTMTALTVPDPASFATGAAHPGMAGTFVAVRAIDPTLADATNNPNAVTAPNGPGSKAWTVFDPSGGGDCGTTAAVFNTTAASFSVRAWLETTDLPVQFNTSNVQFRGSEITIYGIGCGDALTNLTDIDRSVGLGNVPLPGAESANGFTGICWVYERVAAAPSTLVISEKLHLVDANDGGESQPGGNTPQDWTVLATYNLSSTPSGWHNLSISIDAAGNGTASYDGQITTFTTTGLHSSAFNVGYRENLQQGADGTPDAMMRPPTFTFVPALASLGQLAFAAPSAGAINLTIPAAAGQTIGVEYSTTLSIGSWTDIGNFTIVGDTGTFSDTDAGRIGGMRGFYRAFLR